MIFPKEAVGIIQYIFLDFEEGMNLDPGIILL